MRTWTPVTIGLVAGLTGAAACAATFAWIKLRRRPDALETERSRRQSLGRTGRITQGEIVGMVEPPDGATGPLLLVYHYEVAGVTYEVAQDVSSLPQAAAAVPQMIGEAVLVKYATNDPGNSIVIGEPWSGISGITVEQPAGVRVIPFVAPAGKS